MITQRKVWYKRYKKPRHFCPAPSYNCPKIPLGPMNAIGADYEMVRLVKSEKCLLKNRWGLISWGLNISAEKWPKLKQVLSFDIDQPQNKNAEILLAVN